MLYKLLHVVVCYQQIQSAVYFMHSFICRLNLIYLTFLAEINLAFVVYQSWKHFYMTNINNDVIPILVAISFGHSWLKIIVILIML